MNEKSTSHLESMLKNSKKQTYEQLMKDINLSKPMKLCDYLNSYIADHNLVCSKVKTASLIPKDYADGIFNGHRTNPSRDRVIAITRAMMMDYDSTQRTLKIANVGALYPKNPRDLAIMYAIEHEYTVEKLNNFLDSKGFDVLETQSSRSKDSKNDRR